MASDRMQLQNMCKKGAQIFQKNTPKGGETWQLKWHLNDEKNDDNDSRHITSILLWKMVVYTPSSFVDLVFVGEMIEVGLKRGKSDHHALINEKKLGQMKRVRMREKPMLWLPFLYGQVSHQPNNVITQPITNLLLTHHPVIHKGHP